jgi:ABC-2 type transport system ATP-binding protein
MKATSEAAIRCEGLSKSYGGVKALRDLDLVVEPGTIFGFLGPNGAGKTTTARLLTGLARPTRGRAWVAGHEVTADGPEARRSIGYLPEEPAFYPWMTGTEFLAYVGRLFGLRGAELERRVEELLDVADLGEAAGRRVGGYSRGMRQRLGVAQALINHPRVLLLDEPASALDPQGRRDLLTLIERLREQATVFMSTHILSDVERVCDRVGIIDAGGLLVEADRRELQDRYAPPVFELAWGRGEDQRASIEAFVTMLEGMQWVRRVEREDRELRVHVTDLSRARRDLLSLVVQEKLPLDRFELMRPSLEDVFLHLVGEEALR